jgi:hypothetical protein
VDRLIKRIIPAWIKDGIGGFLDLRGTAVKTLGQLESVGGSLCLQGTVVKTLGQLKSVGWSLCLQGTAVKTVPEALLGRVIR